ncbi:hypothetical protein [Fictibacillus gelatini]|uniref:hypothetical protein n=1 Tax=Fictibacillus gelatini TaxID=225985 RepID=UPI0004164F05|nr:hypothetical protein [Fictibacillus gelatini]
MKKFFLFCLSLLIIYTMAYDLKIGTLEPLQAKTKMAPKNSQEKIFYQRVKVKAGDTVLSVVEQLHQKSAPRSMAKLIRDFRLLNNIHPEDIQIGHVYKFPIYPDKK